MAQPDTGHAEEHPGCPPHLQESGQPRKQKQSRWLAQLAQIHMLAHFASLFLGGINAVKADTLSTVIPLDLNTEPGDQ